MSDQAFKYEGYNVLPVTDKKTQKVVGWDVSFLNPPKFFATKEQAKAAIDDRRQDLQQQYAKYFE